MGGGDSTSIVATCKKWKIFNVIQVIRSHTWSARRKIWRRGTPFRCTAMGWSRTRRAALAVAIGIRWTCGLSAAEPFWCNALVGTQPANLKFCENFRLIRELSSKQSDPSENSNIRLSYFNITYHANPSSLRRTMNCNRTSYLLCDQQQNPFDHFVAIDRSDSHVKEQSVKHRPGNVMQRRRQHADCWNSYQHMRQQCGQPSLADIGDSKKTNKFSLIHPHKS